VVVRGGGGGGGVLCGMSFTTLFIDTQDLDQTVEELRKVVRFLHEQKKRTTTDMKLKVCCLVERGDNAPCIVRNAAS